MLLDVEVLEPEDDDAVLLESDDLPLSEDLVSEPLLFVEVDGELPDDEPRLSVR